MHSVPMVSILDPGLSPGGQSIVFLEKTLYSHHRYGAVKCWM